MRHLSARCGTPLAGPRFYRYLQAFGDAAPSARAFFLHARPLLACPFPCFLQDILILYAPAAPFIKGGAALSMPRFYRY